MPYPERTGSPHCTVFVLLLLACLCWSSSCSQHPTCHTGTVKWLDVVPSRAGEAPRANHDVTIYLDNSQSMEPVRGESVYQETLQALEVSKPVNNTTALIRVRYVGAEVGEAQGVEALERATYQEGQTNLFAAVQQMRADAPAANQGALIHVLVTDGVQDTVTASEKNVNRELLGMLEAGWSGHVIGLRCNTRPFYLFIFSRQLGALKKYVTELKNKLVNRQQQDATRELPLTADFLDASFSLKNAASGYDVKQLRFTANDNDLAYARGYAIGASLCLNSETTQPQALTLTLKDLPWKEKAKAFVQTVGLELKELPSRIEWSDPELVPAKISVPMAAASTPGSPAAVTKGPDKYPVLELVRQEAGKLNLQLRWSQPTGPPSTAVYRLNAYLRLDDRMPSWVQEWSTEDKREGQKTYKLARTLRELLGKPRLEALTIYLRVG